MRLTLLDALHARPANLFVRVASRYAGTIEIRTGERHADAKNILEVLTLSAAKGEDIELSACGEDAESALAALSALVLQNFDADLVPETGAAAAPGIAIGPALVLPASVPASDHGGTGPAARARLEAAFVQVKRDLQEIVSTLPEVDAALFEPEIAIVRALEERVMARVLRDESVEHALREEAPAASSTGSVEKRRTTDLLLDARERLLEAFANDHAPHLARRLAETADGDVILIAEELTPSIVAAAPRRVAGIVAALADLETDVHGFGYTSHAAILARGRGIPLMFVAPHVAHAIEDGHVVVLDTRTSPAGLWVTPSEARVAAAQTARAEHVRQEIEHDAQAAAPLTHLAVYGGAPFAIRVNVGSVHDRVPTGSDGVGLIRTELLFSGRTRAPSLEDQLAMLLLVAGKVATGPVIARLFDAGGDKPLTWILPPSQAPDAQGIDLLQRHPDLLRNQVTAIARASEIADVRILVPFVRHAGDVELVRGLAPAALSVGAMIESPDAVAATSSIARAADFICIGTNDLTAIVRGVDRARATAGSVDARVLEMIAEVVDGAHGEDRTVTVCGEMAGDPDNAAILAGLGVDAISVAPSRLASIKSVLATMTAGTCREAARKAMGEARGSS